jgi:predicted RNA binding protein YcfA (HicA-like mRNA interferase family)
MVGRGRREGLSEFGVLAHLKVRDAIKLIEDDGWSLVATRGSHRQFKHPLKPGRVTIAGKPSDDLAPGTLNSILKQAGLKERQ